MVQRTELKDACLFLAPDSVTKTVLLVQHDADYIDRVDALSQGEGGDADFLAYAPPGSGHDAYLAAMNRVAIYSFKTRDRKRLPGQISLLALPTVSSQGAQNECYQRHHRQ